MVTASEATLLQVLLDYAPDAKAQARMVTWFKQGEAYCQGQDDPDGLVKALAYALADGFRYGTWPWMPVS